jgi:hypothetical protein
VQPLAQVVEPRQQVTDGQGSWAGQLIRGFMPIVVIGLKPPSVVVEEVDVEVEIVRDVVLLEVDEVELVEDVELDALSKMSLAWFMFFEVPIDAANAQKSSIAAMNRANLLFCMLTI